MSRLEIASRILAGFAANPSVFAYNPRSGWGLVNCTDETLAEYALGLADKLMVTEATNPASKPGEEV